MKMHVMRKGVPATHLYVEIIKKHEDALGKVLPVSFVLPGGPGADHTAYLSYTCLNEVTDLVFHDPRGCGKSEKGAASTYTMNNYINDVESIRQQLSLNKITIIGKSYGSMCALGYAIRFPDAVNKLVLAAGAPSYRFFETAKKNLLDLGNKEQIAIGEKLWQGDFKSKNEMLQYFRLMSTLYSVKARTQLNEKDILKKAERFSYEVLNEGMKHSLWHFDYENELQQVSCPTLILAGSEDWINDVKYAEQMVRCIPHAQLHVFKESGHAMEADVALEYFQTIADFIQR